ncbi:hypothetical protein WJX74_005148 [Apatococcus lobatus]|uniref:Smr domain-containing protein n=1 Tax=Apatococcus lobatus TaxID=904363 RepID=A0AAW1RXD9_9CHLO
MDMLAKQKMPACLHGHKVNLPRVSEVSMSEVEVQLAEAFPEVPRSRLRQVLNAAGEDVHAAAAQLLEEAVSQQPAVAAKSEPQRQQQQAASRTQPQVSPSTLSSTSMHQSSRRSNSRTCPSPTKGGWHSLTAAAAGQGRRARSHSPAYLNPSAAARFEDDPSAFPDLNAPALPAATEAHNSHNSRDHGTQQQGTSHAQPGWSRGMGGMRMGMSGRIQNGRSPAQGSRRPACASKRASEEANQALGKSERANMQSPSSVLDARLEDPADAAQQPLPYSAVVGAQPNGPRSKLRGLHRKSRSLDGADVQISRTSPWDGSEGPASDGYAEDEQALRLAHPWASEELTRAVLIAAKHHHLTAAALLRDMGPQAAVAAAAATPAGAWELSAQTQQHLTISQASQSQLRADAPSWSPSGTAAPKEAHGHLDPGGTSTDEDPCEEDDPYWQLRRPALRLTREWQRLLRRAAASYSLDDHHSARALAAEARGVRERAMAAHTAAAAAIQAANNKDKGPWELDLHGLHVSEAIDAVAARINECRSLQSSISSPNKLRIIVGKGNHSSLGEASLPRVIAGVLSKQSLHFEHVGGIINVLLRTRQG